MKKAHFHRRRKLAVPLLLQTSLTPSHPPAWSVLRNENSGITLSAHGLPNMYWGWEVAAGNSPRHSTRASNLPQQLCSRSEKASRTVPGVLFTGLVFCPSTCLFLPLCFCFFCQAYTHSHYKEYSRFLCTDYMLLENGNGCPLATLLLFLWGNSSGMTFVTLGRGSKAGMWLCHKPSWPSDRTEDGGGREGNPGGDTGAEAGSKEIQRVPVGGDLKQREQQGQPGGLEWDCIS